MKFPTTAALLACAASQAHAFSDSSPFILFSTAKLPSTPSTSTNPQLQTSSQVLTTAKSLLVSCPTRRYLLVSQPNLHASDIRDDNSNSSPACHMPNLCRTVQDKGGDNVWSVAEVIGQVEGAALEEYIKGACAGGEGVSVERVELGRLPAVSAAGSEGRRREVLGDNDHELGKLLETLNDDYTVLLFSDPNEFRAYEPEFSAPVHVDMKRWAEAEVVHSQQKSNVTDKRPLFEKYQFFTPGIFMSLIVMVVVLSILGVGLKALAGLEVSYGAFDKEMGPAAQKKQM